jgi:hypothetical protein
MSPNRDLRSTPDVDRNPGFAVVADARATIWPMSLSYQGKVRILDTSGIMYDVGLANLEITDPETRSWGGTIRLFDKSALATKSVTSYLEIGEGRRLKAQVGPRSGDAGTDLMFVKVTGLDDVESF